MNLTIEELFFDFMWHIGVLDRFVLNFNKDQMENCNSVPDVHEILKRASNLTTAFVWNHSYEGWSYWYTVKAFGDALYNKLKQKNCSKKYIEETFKKDLESVFKSIEEGAELHNDYQILIKRIKHYYYNRIPKIALANETKKIFVKI